MTGRDGAPQALLSPGRADGTAGGLPPLSGAYGVSSAPLSVAGPSVSLSSPMGHDNSMNEAAAGRGSSATSITPRTPPPDPRSLPSSPENSLTVSPSGLPASPYLPDTPSTSGGVE